MIFRSVGMRFAGLVLGMAMATGAAGLPTDRPMTDFIHRSWSVDEGLPHSTVRAIAQTADGYIWFGTADGVSRFDGRSFDAHESALFAPLRGIGVYSLLATRDGALYIGTRGKGVWRYRGGALVRVAADLITSGGGAMAEDGQGRVWVSLDTEGLARIAGDSARRFTSADGLPSDTVRALHAAADGTIWVGTNRGLALVGNDIVQSHPTGGALDSASIFALLGDHTGRLLIATSSMGLVALDKGQVSKIALRTSARDLTVSNLLEDRDGGIWVGTTDGLMRIAKGSVDRFTTQDGLSSNTVRSFFEDAEGGVWIGTDRGVNRLRSGAVRGIGERQGLSEEFVRAILQDRAGRVWIATSNGLFLRNGAKSQRFATEQGLVNNSVLSLAEDETGTLWVGTYGGGLHRLAGGRFQAMAEDIRRSQEPVRAIVPVAGGQLWVGTFAGLFRLRADGTTVDKYGLANGLPNELINAMHADAAGRLWLGTRNGLVVRETDGTFRTIPDMYGDSTVLSLSAAADGRLWVSTVRGVGLVTLGATPKVSPPTDRAAIPEQSYFAVLEDAQERVWICGNRGLVKVPLSSLLNPPVHQAGVGLGEVFGRNDGMPTAQCNGATQPSAWKTTEGTLLFATAQGVAVVDPAAKTMDALPPPKVLIKSTLVDGAPVAAAEGGELELSPGSHRLQIEFIAISLSSPERLRYEFRLAGHDDNWIDAGTDTKAVFTNLPSGTYRFDVRSRLAGGVPGERVTSLAVHQQPRLIETWWFRVMLAMGLVAGIVATIGYRVRNLEEQRERLRSKVEERTAELETEKRKLETLNDERSRLLVQVADSARAYERLSKEDALTGLANRRELDRVLTAEFARAVRNARPLSVALCDVDHFKRINDQHSHATGDTVLRHIAAHLKSACRRIDSVGRYGGEEFLIVFPEAGHDEAMHICERLRATLAREPGTASTWPDHLPAVTMSFGVATLGDDASHERLIARADAKLYEAKHGGRNRVCG